MDKKLSIGYDLVSLTHTSSYSTTTSTRVCIPKTIYAHTTRVGSMHTTPLLLCKVWKKANGGAKLPCQLRVSYGLVQNVT